MSLIASILIYVLFATSMYFLAENARKSELLGQNSNANLSLLVAVLLFTILSGLRYRVGMDCEEYAKSYELLLDGRDISNSDSLEKVEGGFLLISQFFATLHLPRFIYMGFWAFLEIGLLTLAFKDRKNLMPVMFAILILGPYYLSLMNGIRQSVVSCAFVYVVQGLMDNRDWKKYLIIILLCQFLHKSAILLLPLVFVMFYDKSPKVALSLILLTACAIVGRMSFVKEYTTLFSVFLEITGYSGYAENMEYYADMDATITSFGPRSMVLFATNLLVILFAGKVNSRFKDDRLYRVSFLFFMIYACCSELLVSMDILFIRPLLYFMPFVLICEAYTILYLYEPDEMMDFGRFKVKITEKMATVVCYGVFIIFSSYLILANIAERNNPEECSLFKFIFME